MNILLAILLIIYIATIILDIKMDKQRDKLIEVLKKTINNLEEDLDRANFKIENRDNFIKDYQEEHEILLNNIAELKSKTIDLENNIESLTNNLSDENKELVIDSKSTN